MLPTRPNGRKKAPTPRATPLVAWPATWPATPALFGTDCGWLGGMRVGGRFSVGGYLLAGNFPGDPQAHPYHAAYLIRFHLDYDGSSDA